MIRYVPALTVYILMVCIFHLHQPLFDFPLDDAWTHCVYAESVAHGNGLCYNIGQPETGSTSPLWVLLTACTHWLPKIHPQETAFYVKCIGFLLGLVTVLSTQFCAEQLVRHRTVSITAGILLSFDTVLLFSVGSGMENTLLPALLITACAALLKKHYQAACILLGLAVSTRPEAILFLAMLPFILMRIKKAHGLRNAITGGVSALLPAAVWFIFCLAINGHPLPQTFYMKIQSAGFSLSTYLISLYRAFHMYGFSSIPILYIGILCLLLVRKEQQHIRLIFIYFVLLPLLYLLGVLATRSIDFSGYYWTRWLEPPIQLISAGAVIGLTCAVDRTPNIKKRSAQTFATALLIFLVVISIPFSIADFKQRRQQFRQDCTAIRRLNVNSGLWLRENTRNTETIGLHDAGAIRFFSQRRCIDLAGLNNASAAFGTETYNTLLQQCDWLAVFPQVLQNFGQTPSALLAFKPVVSVTVPAEDYTIAHIEHPISMVIYQKTVTPNQCERLCTFWRAESCDADTKFPP